MANSGASKLAQVLAERITSQTAKPDALELGTIQGDMSLKVDRFAVPIPKGEYLVVEWTAKLKFPAFSLYGVGTYPYDSNWSPLPPLESTPRTRWDWRLEEIDNVKIEVKPDLKPGDRVLVAWVNNYTDPVILSKVVSS